MRWCEPIPRYARRTLGLILVATAVLAIAAGTASAQIGSCNEGDQPDWADGCFLEIQDAVDAAGQGWFVVLPGSSVDGAPVAYDPATVDVEDLTICAGPAPDEVSVRGPVYLTDETGHCERRSDAVLVDGDTDPALAIEAPGVTVKWMTLRARASNGDVATVDVKASDATIRGATVEIEGGGCSVDEIPTASCEAPPRGVGVRFSPGATGGTVNASTIEASPVDGSSGSVAALDGVRSEADGTTVMLSTIRGFAGSGVHATAPDAEVVATLFEANHRGVRLGPGADGAVVELSRFVGDGVGVALAGNATDDGPEGVAFVDNDLRALTGVGLEIGSATEGLFVDAHGNDWGAYECSAVPTRIRDLGTGNLVDYLPFDTPVGVEECPSGTTNYQAQFTFDPPLAGPGQNRLAFESHQVDVTVELFDASGDEKAFPGDHGPALIAEPAGIGADCAKERAYDDPAELQDNRARFEVPAADLICLDPQPTVWTFKVVSPVDHPVPDAADRLVFSYHNADADQLSAMVPPLADFLDREGTNLQATAEPVAMEVTAPDTPQETSTVEPVPVNVTLLDAAGRRAKHLDGSDNRTVRVFDEDAGTEWAAIETEVGFANISLQITDPGDYGSLVARSGDLEESLQNVTVTLGPLDHVTFTMEHGSTEADTPVTFEAEARDGEGNPRGDALTWSIPSGSGSIDGDGTFVPDKVGTTTIQVEATDEGNSTTERETTQIDVTVGELDHVTFTEAPGSTNADTPVTFEAEARDGQGNPRNDPLDWSIASGSGSIDQDGTFDPAEVGTTTIQVEATDEDNGTTMAATTEIEVAPGPLDHVTFVDATDATDAVTPVDLTAEPRDAEDNARDDDVTYEIASGGGSVDADTGRFVPDETGTTRVRAEATDDTGTTETATTQIRVDVGPLHDVVFTRAPDRTDADTSVTFVALPVDAKGNARDDPVTYQVSQGGGTIDDDGTYHPDEAGPAVVRASAGDAVSATGITVDPGALDEVAFTASPDAVAVGLEATFDAEARDAHGNARDDEVTFAVVDGPGQVDDNGTFVADTPGEATVRAAAGGVDATTTIEVTAGDVADIAVRPDRVTRTAGETTPVTFEVTAHDAHGNPVEVDPVDDLDWSTDDADAGSFDGAAFDPADRAGETTVTATLVADDRVQATATVVVEPGPVDRIDVTPASLRLAPGETADLSPTVVDAFGNERPAALTWSLLDDVGTIDAPGRLTASSPGQTEAVVRHDPTGTEERVPVIVAAEPGSIASIQIEPASLTLPAGSQHQLRVQATDADGFVDPDVEARLQVADPTVASLGPDGILTADQAGTTSIQAVRGGHEVTAEVTVVPGSLARIRVAPSAATLTPGDRLDLSATGADLRFNPAPLDDVDWSLAGDDVGDLTGDGTFVATAEGDGRIVASAQGVETTVPVTVTTRSTSPGSTTDVLVKPVQGQVGDVTATTWSAGLARARAGSTLTFETVGDGDLERARVDVDRDADRLSVVVTTQPGDLPAAPSEVDLVDLSQVASNRTDPAMFVGVGATREGVDLDSRQLNEVVGGMELTFRVPAGYFDERDLEPGDVTLREYSEGRTAGEAPARLLAQEPVDGAYRYAVDLDSFSAFAVLGGTGHAPARMDWSMILIVGFAGLFAAVAVVTWTEWRG